MTGDTAFTRLVSLACHDLRTPLATVQGFATTLERMELEEQARRYLDFVTAASKQMAALLDELGLAVRIEGGRYEPALEEADTLELVKAAAERIDGASGSGKGSTVHVDVGAAEQSLAALASCALRHGGLKRVELEAAGSDVRISPVTEQAAPVVLARELKDLGAAVAGKAFEALGGSLALERETLTISLPAPD